MGLELRGEVLVPEKGGSEGKVSISARHHSDPRLAGWEGPTGLMQKRLQVTGRGSSREQEVVGGGEAGSPLGGTFPLTPVPWAPPGQGRV